MAALPQAVLKAIAGGRASGAINLNNKGLTEVPNAVYDLDIELPGGGESKWWEVAEVTKLDLSHNKLQMLPKELAMASTLQILDVSHNVMTKVPDELGALASLRSLDFSNNRLLGLPQSLAALPSLASLTAASNQLQALPDGLGARQPLAVLSAPDNAITALPAGLSEAKAMVRIDLSGNKISALPGYILMGLKSLTELDLSRNALSGVLAGEVGLLPRLKVLRLRENRLAGLPPTIAGCTSLVELYCGSNCLTSLPAELGLLSGSLKTLEVRGNQLTTLPEEVCDLRLSLFDLANNDLRGLPPALGRMTSLRSLPLEGNPLKSIRREVVAGPISGLLKHLESRIGDEDEQGGAGPRHPQQAARSGNVFGVDEASLAADMARKVALSSAGGQSLMLAGRGLAAVPHEVWASGAALAQLDLSNNPLPGIDPQALAALPGLRVLRLNTTGLQYWPLPIVPDALPALQELQVRQNSGLRQVPQHGLVACPALLRLEMAGTPAGGCLPPGFLCHAPSLEQLDLAQCGCAELPWCVLGGPLARLRILNLANNRISTLPEAVATLSKLEELNLTNNNLGNVPPQLGLMAPGLGGALRALGLDGNPLRTLRRPILERGTPAVLQYLKDRIPA